eukprot:scaffold1.g5238.t1
MHGDQTTARTTRALWAFDLMAKAADAQGEALLAVQQMRNMVVASTLLVMGLSQVLGRLLVIMTSNSNLQTIDSFPDPITGTLAAGLFPAYIRAAVPLAFTLLALLCFAQCARLAVHLGFLIRVRGTYEMTERASLYFTLGLRCLYGFVMFLFFLLGITALVITTAVVGVLLLWSDTIRTRTDYERSESKGFVRLSKHTPQRKHTNGEASAVEGEGQDGCMRNEQEQEAFMPAQV